jgi:ubiquinone/menaquinone biosynthesis C-methylase UbiE
MKAEELKLIVKEKYGEIVTQSIQENSTSCCCSSACCSEVDYTVFSEKYDKLEGYNPDADFNLGCGIPTEFATIRSGDIVVDLGSGAGNDCFVARALAGESGKIIGIDMTEAMIEKARANVKKSGYDNVEFRLGEIENMPVEGESADVVISNCVLNLVPDKSKAFSEIFRILKPGGHLSVSDVVIRGDLPEEIRSASEMYAGCVSGAIEMDKYLKMMSDSGLINVEVRKSKIITLPDETLLNYLDRAGLDKYKQTGAGIYSITVYGEKAGS